MHEELAEIDPTAAKIMLEEKDYILMNRDELTKRKLVIIKKLKDLK